MKNNSPPKWNILPSFSISVQYYFQFKVLKVGGNRSIHLENLNLHNHSMKRSVSLQEIIFLWILSLFFLFLSSFPSSILNAHDSYKKEVSDLSLKNLRG